MQAGAKTLNLDARRRGMRCKALLGSLLNLTPNDCGILCDALQDSTSRRRIGIANHRAAGFAGADFRTTRGPAGREQLWDESFSRSLLAQVFEESLPLFPGQELVIA